MVECFGGVVIFDVLVPPFKNIANIGCLKHFVFVFVIIENIERSLNDVAINTRLL